MERLRASSQHGRSLGACQRPEVQPRGYLQESPEAGRDQYCSCLEKGLDAQNLTLFSARPLLGSATRKNNKQNWLGASAGSEPSEIRFWLNWASQVKGALFAM
jgi:hypothetical protein